MKELIAIKNITPLKILTQV